MYYQQGDVILKKVTKAEMKKLKTKEVQLEDKVLQRGETTGHKHQFVGSAALKVYSTDERAADPGQVLRITDLNGRRFIEVLPGDEPALLKHEEHKPIHILPGLYELDIVREFDWVEGLTRRVLD